MAKFCKTPEVMCAFKSVDCEMHEPFERVRLEMLIALLYGQLWYDIRMAVWRVFCKNIDESRILCIVRW